MVSTDPKSCSNWREEFLTDLQAIRKKGKEGNLSDEEIDDLFYQSPWFDEPLLLQSAFTATLKVNKVLGQ